MRLQWKLTVASFKMYFRQREAIIWSFVFPLLIVVLFSFVHFNGIQRIDLGVADESAGARFLDSLRHLPAFKITEGGRTAELAELEKGERDLVLVIPQGFRWPSAEEAAGAPALQAFVNAARPQQAELGVTLVQRLLDDAVFVRMPENGRILLRTTEIRSRNLTYVDYLLPGIISMAIMQMGIFGTAFGFVSLKKRGILRRLSVTPVRPVDFIVAQVVMRVVVVLAQIALMVGVGVLFLHLHFIGSLSTMFLIGLLGAVVFLGLGFAIAGVSKSEDQVAPLANIVTLPMLLLGGVFFSRSNFPGILHRVTEFMPLTFLADAMRAVAIEGSALTAVWPQLAGLAAWGVISCVLAIRLFRWE
jgi:ABC-2 type transport system permease protein